MFFQKKKLNNFWDFFLTFILLICSFAIFGLQPLGGNNVVYIPFIEHLQNANLFPGDPFLETLKYHPTLFFNFIASLSNFLKVSIKELLFFLPWPVFFAQALIIFFIAKLLFKNRQISYLILIFLLSPKFSLAFESIGINLQQVTPTTFSIPLGLLAIYFYLKERKKMSFSILGIVANIQPIITIQLALLLTFGELLEEFKKKKGLIFLTSKLMEYYFFLLMGSLPILFVLKKNSDSLLKWFETSQEWFRIVAIRSSHHFFPSRWQFLTWLIFGFFALLFYMAVNFKNKKSGLNDKDNKIISLILAFIPIFLITEFFSEILPVRAIILLSLFRSFSFFTFFCLCYIAYYIFNLLKSDNVVGRLVGLFLSAALFLPTSVFYSFNFLKPSIMGVFLFFTISSLAVLALSQFKVKKREINKIILGLAAMFLFLASCQRLYRNYKNWGRFTFDNSSEKNWRLVQFWANNNASVDTIFITPPQQTGFRVFGQRTIVGEYKDGANFIYHPYLLTDWQRRMTDLQVKMETAKGAFILGHKELRNEEMIKELAKKYDASYLVSSFNDLGFSKVYNNNQFAVYKLK